MHALLNINARVSVSGATAPYTIQYGGCGSCATTANPATFTGLKSGNYSIIVYDANGCAFVQSNVVVAAPAPLVITFATTPQVSCTSPDGTATANPSGGTPPYTYLWSNGTTSASLSGLVKGTYTVTVTDNKLCVATANASVDLSLSLNLSVTQPCGGADNGSATAIVSGGTTPYTYSWNTTPVQTTATATGLAPGNYSVFVTDNKGCQFSTFIALTDTTSYTHPNGLVITSDTVLNFVHFRINKGIQVNDGVTLTIFNSTLEFSDFGHTEIFADSGGLPLMGEKGIFLKHGAKLKLFGVKLQAIEGCSNMWDGIGVFITAAFIKPDPSTDINAGFVKLLGCTIQDAHVGIQAGGSGSPPGQITKLNVRPGAIHSTGTTFLNNRKHIVSGVPEEFIDVRSNFTNTKFFCTGPLKDLVKYGGEGTDIFMDLTNVTGIKIDGCHFKSNITAFPLAGLGVGIRSQDSKYDVAGSKNIFEQLYYGIDANTAFPVRTVKIDNAEFRIVYRGILMRNMNYPTVTRNKFNLSGTGGYGFYLDGCTGYQVEENEFFGTGGFPKGVIVNNSGNGGDEIYKNTFHDILNGIQPQGIASLNSNEELQIKCNDFTNNIFQYHIAVTSGDIPDQGNCLPSSDPNAPSASAGNTFTHECNFTDSDIGVHSGTFFRYNHHADLITTPVCYDAVSVDPVPCPIFFIDSLSCPSHLDAVVGGGPCSVGPGGSACRIVIDRIRHRVQVLQNQFDSLVDGGKTDELLMMIQQGQTAGKVKDTLLKYSPYISDTVLVSLIRKNHPYPPGMIKEVIIANSDVTQRVIDELLNRTDALPKGIIKEISDAQSGISARADLEAEIRWFERQRNIAVNELNRAYLNDTTLINPLDSVIAILEQEEGTTRNMQLVSAYIANNNFVEAMELLDSLGFIQGLENFAAINKIIISVLEDSASFDTLLVDTALRQTVESIANDSLKFGYLSARAIMSQVFGIAYPELIEELPLQPQSKWGGNNNSEQTEIQDSVSTTAREKEEETQFVKIYPNPAVNKITAEYHLTEKMPVGKITFYNLLGISKEYEIEGDFGKMNIDVSGWSSGLYYYTVIVNNNTIARNKIVVMKN